MEHDGAVKTMKRLIDDIDMLESFRFGLDIPLVHSFMKWGSFVTIKCFCQTPFYKR